jgi:hypothetical protein
VLRAAISLIEKKRFAEARPLLAKAAEAVPFWADHKDLYMVQRRLAYGPPGRVDWLMTAI